MSASRHILRSLVTGLILFFSTGSAAQDLQLLALPTNSAITMPAGQGLDLIGSAEPLGKGRYRFRTLNRSTSVTVPDVGDGSLYTGLYSIGYGLRDAMELSLVLPFLMDSVGGLTKYGSGDPVLGVKWSRPPKVPWGTHTAFQLLIGLPLGYKGEHALDQIGGVRSFTRQATDLGLQGMMDIHFRTLSVYANGGLFRAGNAEVETQVVYGLGLEFLRAHRWVSFNTEYQARAAFAQQSTAANILKFGIRVQALRGVEVELNREIGFLNHPTKSAVTFGLRTHGFLTGGRRKFLSRAMLYEEPPPPERIYEPDQMRRIAILDFSGFEEFEAGKRVVDRIKVMLEPHDSLEVVNLSRFSGVPTSGTLTPRESIDIARKLDVDVIVTGTVADYEIERFAGPKVPYLFELPETEIQVALRYRVMWWSSAAKSEMKALTQTISASRKVRKRIRLLPADRPDITVRRTAAELQGVQDSALNDIGAKFLASMARHFSWIPPDLAYAQVAQ